MKEEQTPLKMFRLYTQVFSLFLQMRHFSQQEGGRQIFFFV